MMNNKSPEIRFKGFTDDWEQRKLGEITTYRNGGSFENDVVNQGKYELVTLKSVDVEGNLKESGKFINIEVENLKSGTIVMILSEQAPGLLGKTTVIPRNDYYVLNQRVAALIPQKSTESFFLSQAINRNGKYFSMRGAGTKVQNISKPNVENFQMFVPTYDEQCQIGTFFKQLDNTIALHQDAIQHQKDLKKALLQKFFPVNGARIPTVRFANFKEEWEQRKLGALAESFNYGLNASAMEFDGENKYIRITDIDEESHRFIQSGLTSPNTDLSNADDYLLKEGDILFARTGASVGKSYQYEPLDGKVYYAGFLIRARIKPEFDSSYIFQSTLTEKYKNFIKISSQRSGQPGVNAQEYASFSVSVPSRAEQEKIGTFFKQLDDTITLHQDAIHKFQLLKQSLLQKMFVN